MWVYGNRRSDCAPLLLSGLLFLAVSQGLEGMGGSVAALFRAILIGLAGVCGLLGLVLYARRKG